MYSPSLMSPFLSPVKSDANPGVLQGLKLFSTDKIPSESEAKESATQVAAAGQNYPLPENEPLGNNYKQQKTLMIESNPSIV